MTLLFHTFLDSGSSVFNSLTSVRLTFGGFSGILSSTEAPLPLWVVPWATSCVGAQFVSWPWWEPGLCILSVSLLTAASNFSKSSSSFTWVFAGRVLSPFWCYNSVAQLIMNAETHIVPAKGHTLSQILLLRRQGVLSVLCLGGEQKRPKRFPPLPVLQN